MKPNSEYTLTDVDNLKLNKENFNIDNKNHRVELFINNEYKGVYELGYIEEEWC